MCQKEFSKPEYCPLLSSTIDDSYHSFSFPRDQSFWTRKLSKLRNGNGSDDIQCNTNDNEHVPWRVILFGQSIALALAVGNSSISSLENKCRIHLPAMTMAVVYFGLSFHLVYLFVKQLHEKRKEQCFDVEICREDCTLDDRTNITNNEQVHFVPFTSVTLHTPWQAYLLLAILDVEANYLTMLSFRHTSLSSSMLLTSLSVFSTVLFRRCIFGKTSNHYSCKKIIGVFISVAGACLWIRKDFHQNNHALISGQYYRMYGDLLALASALLYGLNDVLLEYTVKSNNDRTEYLGMIGMFGFLFSVLVQAPLFESQELSELKLSFSKSTFSDGLLLIVVFIVTMTYFYVSVTAFLAVNDATMLNLSLQSSPLWAVILSTLMVADGALELELPPVIFFVALAMVVIGMFLYETGPLPKKSENNC